MLGSWVAATCLVTALDFAAVTRSWLPLVFFAGLLLVVNIVQASASTLLAVRAGRQSWDAFTSLHVVVAASAVAFLLAGATALGEQAIDGRMYARCGEWYPQVYTVAATVAAFEKAQAETAGDKPGMPFIIERDDE
ncbi:hypothetical protein [Verminephrobacter eiseniae]|uniref:Uncharacterized protein n=1 Tax=Verminephrobacter eiseniae (strain EF01-2) TaxID=391735 RepID=A1WLT5_VEREI|nr:hypothetical protein [Verminephrobacter eiseniae]ABM58592.1 hypothetical protein Veis_2856 [Verminephrobacter eiseniae EF01-2]MCW5284167.1 hypothetical protein [Verminephrobacter eiseniae]MCW5301875.1 hypothetical protein [Verminephrobacter eiseniae]MCW8182553.1 hypothetical protein [Verminephrobacter eiseniae]MCW8189645.1 hypothetical protein [Verminephrobacter eiseniae]